ncbi:tryptophan--tRNA ligase [Sorangium sp. So ce1335]|uniref:tryptophan--tRNA ligase n=1 Tax=Sorangium sp. So ce1335 TaxID=3133335 RepID=UPI003F600CA0
MSKKVIFSGIQPSGRLMLGNYLGALKNWVKLQDDYDCLYCLVDMHAITVPQDPRGLRNRTYEGLAMYLAAGIDPARNIIFAQSHVPAHAELSWLLTCNAYMGELSRMTQFKDKSAKEQNIGAGLFAYPVLMAADILLYQTDLVPVGQDQKQHLELARDIAIRVNSTYGDAETSKDGTVTVKNPIFRVPEPYIPPVGARIMSLQNPSAKMSKSDADVNATVFLDDSDDTIRKKIKRAVTDSGSEIVFAPEREDKAGVTNLISIQAAITGKDPHAIVEGYAGKQYGHLKVETAEIVVELLRPLRERHQALLQDKGELDRILAQGAERAAARAEPTLRRMYEAVGFLTRAPRSADR